MGFVPWLHGSMGLAPWLHGLGSGSMGLAPWLHGLGSMAPWSWLHGSMGLIPWLHGLGSMGLAPWAWLHGLDPLAQWAWLHGPMGCAPWLRDVREYVLSCGCRRRGSCGLGKFSRWTPKTSNKSHKTEIGICWLWWIGPASFCLRTRCRRRMRSG